MKLDAAAALATAALPAALAALILTLGATAQFDPVRESTIRLVTTGPLPAGAYTITLLSDEPAGAEVTAWPASPVPPGDCPDCPTCPPPRPCPAPDCRPQLRLSFIGEGAPGGVRGDEGAYRGYVPWQLLTDVEVGISQWLHCRVPSAVVGMSRRSAVRPPTKAERMEAALATVCEEGEVPWAGSVIGPADDSHVVARCVDERSEERDAMTVEFPATEDMERLRRKQFDHLLDRHNRNEAGRLAARKLLEAERPGQEVKIEIERSE